MANGDLPTLAELDELIERAVERQVAEQRALRQTLDRLREAIEAIDTTGSATGTVTAEVDLGAIDERVRRAVESAAAQLSGELREVREALETDLASDVGQAVRSIAGEVKSLGSKVDSVEGEVGGVGADVEGIAQALIDLNAGLRSWADDVDRSVKTLGDTVDAIRELAQTRAVAEAAEGDGPAADDRIERIEKQVKETAELSLYLADQVEDLDRIIKTLGDLPEKVEGTITQAMRRAVTARTKVDEDLTALVDEWTASLEDSTGRLSEVLKTLDASGLRKLTLQTVELGSQIASLHETMVARIAATELEHRRGIEVLAGAIDRWAKGQEPRAVEAITKASVPRKRAARTAPKKKTSPKERSEGSRTARRRRTREPDAED